MVVWYLALGSAVVAAVITRVIYCLAKAVRE